MENPVRTRKNPLYTNEEIVYDTSNHLHGRRLRNVYPTEHRVNTQKVHEHWDVFTFGPSFVDFPSVTISSVNCRDRPHTHLNIHVNIDKQIKSWSQ